MKDATIHLKAEVKKTYTVKRGKFVESNVTDVDIIKLHIDIALMMRDKDEFYKLVKKLKEVTK